MRTEVRTTLTPPAARKGLLLFAAIAVAGCAWDLASKAWVFRTLGPPNPRRPQHHWLIEGVFSLTTNLNEGALFGMGAGYSAVFALLSALAVLGIVYWVVFRRGAQPSIGAIALGLVLAGASGNLYDRLGLPGLQETADRRVFLPGTAPADEETVRVHAVRDFLYFALIDWPIFNFADSFLVTGACLLLLQSMRKPADVEPANAPAVSAAAAPTAAAFPGVDAAAR